MRLRQSGVARAVGAEPAVPTFAVVPGGVVVAHDGELRGLDSDLGHRWLEKAGRRSTPWIENEETFLVDEVFDRDGPNKLRRRRLATGLPGLGTQRKLGSCLTSGSGILVRRESGVLIGLSTDDFTERWSRLWYSEIQLQPTASSFGAVLRGHNGWSIRCVNWLDGTDRWTFDVKSRAPAGKSPEWFGIAYGQALHACGDRVVALTTTGRIYVLFADSGEIVHEEELGSVGHVALSPIGLWILTGEEAIQFSAAELKVTRRESLESAVRKAFPAGLPPLRGVAVADDMFALRSEHGRLIAIRKQGDRWLAADASVPGIVPFFESPVIANDRIYVLDRENMTLLAFRVES